jgi:hypothetical protein
MEDTASATHDIRCTSNSRAAHSLHRCSAEWAHVFSSGSRVQAKQKGISKRPALLRCWVRPTLPQTEFLILPPKTSHVIPTSDGKPDSLLFNLPPLLDAAKQRNQCHLGSPFSRFENEVFLHIAAFGAPVIQQTVRETFE